MSTLVRIEHGSLVFIDPFVWQLPCWHPLKIDITKVCEAYNALQEYL